jgi:tight adherence protein C
MAGEVLQAAFIVGFLVSLSVIAFWFGLRRPSQTDEILERLSWPGERQRVPEALEMELSFADRVLKPMLRGLLHAAGRLMPQRDLERLRRDLEAAGRPYGISPTDFLGLRLVSGIMTGAFAFFVLRAWDRPLLAALLLAFAAALVGSLIPRMWLRQRIQKRREEVLYAMPDALDMLTIAVSAGLGFDGALLKLSQKWDNVLAREFGHVVREMQVGVPRVQALRDMAERIDVKEFSNFVAVIVQADQLGLSIASVLQTQAAQMRILRRQRAEELARQAPIKMLFPLIFLIFPAMFAVILGPAVPTLIDLFGGF